MGDNSGLSHAGEEHNSSSPDSDTKIVTPSELFLKFIFKLAGVNCKCWGQGIRLFVATAQGHPLVRVSLGRRGCDEGRVSRTPGPRAPTPRTAAGSATLPVLPTGSGVVPPPQTRTHACTKAKQKLWLAARLCPPSEGRCANSLWLAARSCPPREGRFGAAWACEF